VLLRTAPLDAAPAPPAGWREVARVGRPTDRVEVSLVYRRSATP
jgi:hypothetical protein